MRLLFPSLGAVFCAFGVAVSTAAGASISVGPGGAGPLTFDTMPGLEFLSGYISDDANSFDENTYRTPYDVDAFVIPYLQASDFTVDFTLARVGSATTIMPGYAYSFLYHALYKCLYSRALSPRIDQGDAASAAVVMLAKVQNNTGTDQSYLTVSYDMGVSNAQAGELTGYRVYYSVTGERNTWTLIPEFTGIETNGTLTAMLSLGSWPDGSLMYLLWFDDNAAGIDPDPAYTIDNLTLTPGDQSNRPIQITDVSSLSNRTVLQCRSTTLFVTFSGSLPTYQWFHDGAEISGATARNYTIANMTQMDAGSYYVRICNGLGCTNSPAAQINFQADNTPPSLLAAVAGTNPYEIILTFNEPIQINDSGELVIGSQLIDSGGDAIYITNAFTLGSTSIVLQTETRLSGQAFVLYLDRVSDTCGEHAFPFDPISVRAYLNPLVDLEPTTRWKYDASGTDLGTAWRATSYDDLAWLSGASPFDAKRGADSLCRPALPVSGEPVQTCLTLSNADGTAELPTYYFRKHFRYAGEPTNAILRLEALIDDGAVVYLNGLELLRLGIAPGNVSYPFGGVVFDPPAAVVNAAWASRDEIGPASLVAGDNVLAVEVHQNGAGSSDITFGLRLLDVSANPPPAPQIAITRSGDNIVITWEGSGVLEGADALPWSEAIHWSAVGVGSGTPMPVMAAQRYYRVRVP